MTSSFDICKFFFEPVHETQAVETSPVPAAPDPNDSIDSSKKGRKKSSSLSSTSNRHQCRICHHCYTQAASTGYTNLLTHLRIKHPDWEETFKSRSLAENVAATQEEASQLSSHSSSETLSVSSTKQRRMAGRKRGPVYEHFDDIPSSPGKKLKKMRCVYCHEDAPQLSGRLKLHLVAKCPQAPEDVKAKFASAAGLTTNKNAVFDKVESVGTKVDTTTTNVDDIVSIKDATVDNMDTSVDVVDDVDTIEASVDVVESSEDATAATLISVAKVDKVTKTSHIVSSVKTRMSPTMKLQQLQTRLIPPKIKSQQSLLLKESLPAPVAVSVQKCSHSEAGHLRTFEEKLTTALITTDTPWSLLDNAAFREAMETLRPASKEFPLTAARARTEVLDRLAHKYDHNCREILATSGAVTLVVHTSVSHEVTKTKILALDESRRVFVLAERSDGSSSPNVDGILSVVSTLSGTSAGMKLFLCAPTSGKYMEARRELLRNSRAPGNYFSLVGACMTQQTALLLHELLLHSLSLEEALDNAVLTADALHVMPSFRTRVLQDVYAGSSEKISGISTVFTQISVTSWHSMAMAVKQANRLEPFLRSAILQEKQAPDSSVPSPILRQLIDLGCGEMTWSTLRHTDQLLTPLHFLSALSELQSTTSGQLLSLWIWLFGAVTRSTLFDGNSDALISSYMQRLACYVEEHFIACLILDPRVHGAGLSASGLRRARGVTVRVATALVPDFNENNFIRSYNEYVKQQGDFGEPGIWNSANTFSPMEFWGDYEGDPLHNQLAVIAKAVCSYVPQSCSLEELWTAHARPNSSLKPETATCETLKEQETCTKIRHNSSVNARANAVDVVSRFQALLDVENEQSVEEMLQCNEETGGQETSTQNVSARSVLERIPDGLEEDLAAMEAPLTPLDATWFDISSAGLDKIRERMESYLNAAMQQ